MIDWTEREPRNEFSKIGAKLIERFKSGNSVPVERAHITLEEHITLQSALALSAGFHMGRSTLDTKDSPRLPKDPPEGLLMSMALRYDHGLGVPGYYDTFGTQGFHAKRLLSTLATMRQLYEEVSGNGFYSPEREQYYKDLKNAALDEVKSESEGP